MLAIKSDKIMTITQGTISGVVLVEDGKIVAVGSNVAIPAGAEVIDATGKYVHPGFIDAHCHVGMWEEGIGFEGADGNEMTHPVTPQLRAIDAINPMDQGFMDALEGGITTIVTGPGSANVVGGTSVAIKTHGRAVDKMVVNPDTGLKCAFGENPKRVYADRKMMPSTRMGTAYLLREALVNAQNYMNDVEAAKKDGKPYKRDLKMEPLVRVLKGELALRAHAHRADDILTAIRIAKEFNVRVTIEHCTEGHLIVDELKEAGVSVVCGPSLSNRSKVELRDLSFKTAGILANAGVNVSIMTDAPVIPIGYLPIAAGLCVKHGMKEEDALKGITINAAQISGIADRVGSLEVGKDADIVIKSKHPFDLMAVTEKVYINGKLVFGA
ncbi:MAG: amidohydrolase [Bacillota bacterium]